MPNKKVVTTKTKKTKKISEENSDILDVLEKPIKKVIRKNKKTSSNTLYKKFSINKKESDRINFDEIYNKQKRNKESSINFIPQEINTIPIQTNKKIVLLIISSLSFLFIIFCFIALFIYKNSFNDQIINIIESNKKLDDVYIREKSKLKILRSVNQDIVDISNIYNNHIYWTNFISFLERNIVRDVYIKDLFVESNGGIVLSLKTNDYENISKQILVLQSFPNIVKKMSIGEASKVEIQEEKYNIDFKLILEIDSKFLLKNE